MLSSRRCSLLQEQATVDQGDDVILVVTVYTLSRNSIWRDEVVRVAINLNKTRALSLF